MKAWRGVICLVGGGSAAGALMLLAGCHAGHQQSVLHPASAEAAATARLWWLMCGVLGVAFVIVIALTLRAVFGRPPGDAGPPGGGARFVVLGGIVIPAFILIGLLVLSLQVTLAQRRPAEGLAVEIVGHQWWWEVRYPETGGVTANELYLPVGEPVLLELWAADVVHSLWVPNLHGKIDLMPEVRNRFWLQAEEAGTWRGQCAEFCGRQHAWMALTVVALPREEFDAWLEERQRPRPLPQEDPALVRRGEEVFFEAACHTCHAVRGTRAQARIGPDLTHVGSRAMLAAGALANDPANLGRWIVRPQDVKPGSLMPATPLAPDDLAALVAYLQSLR